MAASFSSSARSFSYEELSLQKLSLQKLSLQKLSLQKCKQKIGVETPIDLLGCDAKNPVGEKKRHAKKKHITKQV